ncbi:hypothetical protein HDU67_003114 [Dinochytrium kinnereticum]|nr:hypothetical protein HDU67_003114 [Dinochytrium kinnereticum]
MADDLAKKRREARRAKILASSEERLSKITNIYSSAGSDAAASPVPAAGAIDSSASTSSSKDISAPDSPPKAAHLPAAPKPMSATPPEPAIAAPKPVTKQPEVAEHFPMPSFPPARRTPEPTLDDFQNLENHPLMKSLLAEGGGVPPVAPMVPSASSSSTGFLMHAVRALSIVMIVAAAVWSIFFIEDLGESSEEGEDGVLVAPFKKSFDTVAPPFEIFGMEIRSAPSSDILMMAQQLGFGGISSLGGSLRYLYIFYKSITDDLSLFVFLIGCAYCVGSLWSIPDAASLGL